MGGTEVPTQPTFELSKVENRLMGHTASVSFPRSTSSKTLLLLSHTTTALVTLLECAKCNAFKWIAQTLVVGRLMRGTMSWRHDDDNDDDDHHHHHHDDDDDDGGSGAASLASHRATAYDTSAQCCADGGVQQFVWHLPC
jgi:hypothetical protein